MASDELTTPEAVYAACVEVLTLTRAHSDAWAGIRALQFRIGSPAAAPADGDLPTDGELLDELQRLTELNSGDGTNTTTFAFGKEAALLVIRVRPCDVRSMLRAALAARKEKAK